MYMSIWAYGYVRITQEEKRVEEADAQKFLSGWYVTIKTGKARCRNDNEPDLMLMFGQQGHEKEGR